MAYELNFPSQEELLSVGLRALPTDADKSENGFYYPILSAAAIMAHELGIAMETAYGKLYADNLTGDELEAFISDRSSITRRAATKATGTVTFTGTAGAYIPQGTVVASGDYQFATTYGTTIPDGAMSVDVDIAAVVAGYQGYFAPGTVTTLVTDLPDVGTVTNAEALVSGTDAETDGQLLERYRATLHDYPYNLNNATIRAWAQEAAGVGEVRVSASGTALSVYPLDTQGRAITDADKLAEIQAIIDDRLAYGITATVKAVTATPVPVAVKLVSGAADVTAAMVADAIDMLLASSHEYGEPIRGVTRWEIVSAMSDYGINMESIDTVSGGYDASKWKPNILLVADASAVTIS